jgi:hypothetical protein
MVTNYPREAVATRSAAETREPRGEGFLSWLWVQVEQAMCGLHGHDTLLHFDENRIFLRCASCGHETPGWEIGKARPQVRFNGDPQRHLVHPAPMLVDRRIA